jgi:serine phosphatase RsbU (regulator of sigma subunit)
MEIQEIKNEYSQALVELEKLKKENEQLKLFYSELEATNNHLVSATWRERDMKKKLADTISELNTTRLIVEAQNKRIAESINYSKKIQNAINPAEETLHNIISESFILYKPKDVISGDFPWLFERGRYLYLAAVDCTGHGVPGAMMSMIGSLLLNDIVNGADEYKPSEVLIRLHQAVVRTLKQDVPGSNSSDGMDIGLCRIDKESREILFSGAHRPLIQLRNREISQFKGDKFPIGGMQYKGKNNYTDHQIEVKKGDSYFIFSDGLTDQTGGSDGKKYMISSLLEVILSGSGRKASDMKELINQSFEEWKGASKQVDDVILIGFNL